jgi:hypothetical protein
MEPFGRSEEASPPLHSHLQHLASKKRAARNPGVRFCAAY